MAALIINTKLIKTNAPVEKLSCARDRASVAPGTWEDSGMRR